MKRKNSQILHTPIKKWVNRTPNEQELVIIQSDLSQSQSPELLAAFDEPFFATPFSPSPKMKYNDSDLSQESVQMFSSLSQSSESTPHNPVKDEIMFPIQVTLKQLQMKAEKRLPLRQIDINVQGCNCKHSKCEKGYCACLKMGRICIPGVCFCNDCHNLELSKRHKEQIFKNVDGCKCTKTQCLKKYCQCYSGGKKCGPKCQCVGCKNMDQNCQNPHSYEMSFKLRPRKEEPSSMLF